MILLSQLVSRAGIFLDVSAQSQQLVLEQITERMVAANIVQATDRPELMRRLTAREKLCSTAVGHGAAIPHAYFDKFTQPMLVISRVSPPVDFCSPDNKSVDLIFVLLGPERVPAQHIQILSKITRMLKDERFDEQLRTAHDPNEVFDALLEVEKRHH